MAHSSSRESIPQGIHIPHQAPETRALLRHGCVPRLRLGCVASTRLTPILHPQTMTNPQDSRSFRLIGCTETHIGIALAIAFAALLTIHFTDRSRPETTRSLTAMQTVQQPAVLK